MKRATLLLALLLGLSHRAIAGEQVAGAASVIDGDTIEIHGARIRLHGIDAPESSQLCTRYRRRYRCGQEAAFALDDKIGRQVVSCERRDTDRYGRMVAVCTAGGVDLSRWLVRQGHALAYRKYSLDYVADEDVARAAKAGIWAGEFQDPAEVRHPRR
jgi:endonuclease YncB( thermonuclease family)